MSEGSEQERVACLEVALARALELLDEGHSDAARTVLQDVVALAATVEPLDVAPVDVTPLEVEPLDVEPLDEGVSDGELDRAFEEASPERDQMLDADDVAQRAIREADRALEAELTPDQVAPSFATATMAELLELQGDSEGASRIRSHLGPPPAAPSNESGDHRQIIATLERWLDRLGGARP